MLVFTEKIMEELIIDMAIATLLRTVKNPGKVRRIKAALIKVRDVLIGLDLESR